MVVALDNGTIKHCGPPSDVLPLVTVNEDSDDNNDNATTKLQSDTKQVCTGFTKCCNQFLCILINSYN